MPQLEHPCISLAVDRLNYGRSPDLPQQGEHFAIWVLKAPYPGGYVLHNCFWPENLTQTWLAWQEAFSLRGLPHVPLIHHATVKNWQLPPSSASSANASYTSRLMQHLGIQLWQWLFNGPIQGSLAQSQGIAIGQNKPLRLRLEIRDPNLIALPWEIMQPQAGKQAISLNQQILFSRTTIDVDRLPPQKYDRALNILLVLGQSAETEQTPELQLAQEAIALVKILQDNPSPYIEGSQETELAVKSWVDTLIQPTPAELIAKLETEKYNVLFYAGHAIPAPDGGLLFLRPNATLNGTELAQVLVRCRVKLAVFNTCWGAQPDQENQLTPNGETTLSLARSSLAEVLIHHGVPAVLGMRDSIADAEALSFIQAFAQALRERLPIDQAVTVARQHLLTLYKFNQPAWTLPVLYMHPEFDGELTPPMGEGITELPGLTPNVLLERSTAVFLRSTSRVNVKEWQLQGGLMRIGRQQGNDAIISEPWVSQKHAEISRRDSLTEKSRNRATYFLRDFSRFGTFILNQGDRDWQKVHHQEIMLQSGCQLKFGSPEGHIWEFAIEN
jgi:CHAT domain/FHA domain